MDREEKKTKEMSSPVQSQVQMARVMGNQAVVQRMTVLQFKDPYEEFTYCTYHFVDKHITGRIAGGTLVSKGLVRRLREYIKGGGEVSARGEIIFSGHLFGMNEEGYINHYGGPTR